MVGMGRDEKRRGTEWTGLEQDAEQEQEQTCKRNNHTNSNRSQTGMEGKQKEEGEW
jgi:hypothetical protein